MHQSQWCAYTFAHLHVPSPFLKTNFTAQFVRCRKEIVYLELMHHFHYMEQTQEVNAGATTAEMFTVQTVCTDNRIISDGLSRQRHFR